MRINVQLVSMDNVAVPGLPQGSGTLDAKAGSTIADVLSRLALASPESYMTLVNGESVAASGRSARALQDGDTLTVFPPIKGG